MSDPIVKGRDLENQLDLNLVSVGMGLCCVEVGAVAGDVPGQEHAGGCPIIFGRRPEESRKFQTEALKPPLVDFRHDRIFSRRKNQMVVALPGI